MLEEVEAEGSSVAERARLSAKCLRTLRPKRVVNFCSPGGLGLARYAEGWRLSRIANTRSVAGVC